MIELIWPLLLAPLIFVIAMTTVGQILEWIAAFADVVRRNLWE